MKTSEVMLICLMFSPVFLILIYILKEYLENAKKRKDATNK